MWPTWPGRPAARCEQFTKRRFRQREAFTPLVEERGALPNVISRLKARIRSYGPGHALVAVSGGVDSAVVLAMAARALGRANVTAVTAVSPSYPEGELEQARRIALSLGVQHETIKTGEVEKEAYSRNDAMRCFHCKTELNTTLRQLAASTTAAVILAGANADDAADFRPGLLAGERHSVRNPLLEEGLTKPVIRAIARELSLAVAEKPALACLSSRVAYGIRITPELLERIDRAEQAVHGLGFSSVRVRHFGEVAKIELPAADIARFVSHPQREELVELLRALGWNHITLDLEGQRGGSMNASVRISPSLGRRLSR